MNLLRNKPQPNYSLEEIRGVIESPFLIIKAKWNTHGANEIAKELGVSKRQLYRIINGRLKPKKYIVRHARLQAGNIVLDTQTGIYYDNIPVCAEAHDLNKSTLRDYLIGRLGKRKNIYNRFRLI